MVWRRAPGACARHRSPARPPVLRLRAVVSRRMEFASASTAPSFTAALKGWDLGPKHSPIPKPHSSNCKVATNLFDRTYAIVGFGEAGCPLGASPRSSFLAHCRGSAAAVSQKTVGGLQALQTSLLYATA